MHDEVDGARRFDVDGGIDEIYSWLMHLEAQGIPLDFDLAGTRKVWSRVYMKAEGPIIGFVDEEGGKVFLWEKDGNLRVGEVDETDAEVDGVPFFVDGNRAREAFIPSN